MSRIRVAEVCAALSLTTDLATGVPFVKCLRCCAVATACGSVLGLPEADRVRPGPTAVAEFFAVVGSWTPVDFVVLDLIGTGRQAVAEIRAEFALPGGGRLADEELHLWTFDDAGLVTRFRHDGDTAKHIAASRGEDTVASRGQDAVASRGQDAVASRGQDAVASRGQDAVAGR
jgi:hypothetical protein